MYHCTICMPNRSYMCHCIIYSDLIYNYLRKRRWIVVDIYRDVKRRGMYQPLFTDPKGDSCFSIYQIRRIKKRFFNFFFWNFCETTRHFSFRSQNSEYPWIFQVTGANQNARKLLSTDLVNTYKKYSCHCLYIFTKKIYSYHRPIYLCKKKKFLCLC